jgi:Tfp pilus assembly protein PilN
MRSLRLDFLHPLPRPHWAGWLLLATGVALALWVGWQDRQVGVALAEALAAAPPEARTTARRATRAAPGEQREAVESARAQLQVPWSDLFVRLEANRPKRIALVALEADARKTEATVTAEAKNARDMLAWIDELKDKAGFASVTLASHTLREDDPQQPIRFVLRVVWRG